MEKLFFLLFLPLLPFLSVAQTSVYHPFPDSNAFWNVDAQGCCVYDCPGPPYPNPILYDSRFSYYLSDDTIINSLSYHKLNKSSGTVYEHCAVGNYVSNYFVFPGSFEGCIRQDTALRKVFFVYPGQTQEFTLFDFSLNVGDTLTGGTDNWGTDNVVTSIDSILVNGSYRRNFMFNNGLVNVIEGIGGNFGLLGPVHPFEYSESLSCFSQDFQNIYPDTGNCLMISQITPISKNETVKLYPNPFSGQTRIQLTTEMLPGNLNIYNSCGELIHSCKVNSPEYLLDLSGVKKGIYFYTVSGNTSGAVSGKLVIN